MSKPVFAERPPKVGERIAKVMARAGLCSRRDAERWIAEGRVSVDGAKLTSPGVNVTPESRIVVDGKELPRAQHTRLFRFHKPRGMITAASDPEGRPTIYDGMPKALPRLMPVGRLDFNSEGLLLLTNDGELKRRLELPATGLPRRYRARVHGTPDPRGLDLLRRGVTIEGVRYGSIDIRTEREQQSGANCWLDVTLTEGKNREVRRVLEYINLPVNRLIRVAYGPFQLEDIKPLSCIEVPDRKLIEFTDRLKGGA